MAEMLLAVKSLRQKSLIPWEDGLLDYDSNDMADYEEIQLVEAEKKHSSKI